MYRLAGSNSNRDITEPAAFEALAGGDWIRKRAAVEIEEKPYRPARDDRGRWDIMKNLVRGCVLLLTVAGLSAPASAKDQPSVNELLVWTSCLKSNGVDPLGGHRSKAGLEIAFTKCASQENSLRQAIARDPSHFPEYNVDNIKNVARAQQDEPTK